MVGSVVSFADRVRMLCLCRHPVAASANTLHAGGWRCAGAALSSARGRARAACTAALRAVAGWEWLQAARPTSDCTPGEEAIVCAMKSTSSCCVQGNMLQGCGCQYLTLIYSLLAVEVASDT